MLLIRLLNGAKCTFWFHFDPETSCLRMTRTWSFKKKNLGKQSLLCSAKNRKKTEGLPGISYGRTGLRKMHLKRFLTAKFESGDDKTGPISEVSRNMSLLKANQEPGRIKAAAESAESAQFLGRQRQSGRSLHLDTAIEGIPRQGHECKCTIFKNKPNSEGGRASPEALLFLWNSGAVFQDFLHFTVSSLTFCQAGRAQSQCMRECSAGGLG
jgi:hypothetical protein